MQASKPTATRTRAKLGLVGGFWLRSWWLWLWWLCLGDGHERSDGRRHFWGSRTDPSLDGGKPSDEVYGRDAGPVAGSRMFTKAILAAAVAPIPLGTGPFRGVCCLGVISPARPGAVWGFGRNTLLWGFCSLYLRLSLSPSLTLRVYTCAHKPRRDSADELARLATYKTGWVGSP